MTFFPKRWNPTPSWLCPLQHPPRAGWYTVRLLAEPDKHLEAFCCSTYVWYQADHTDSGRRTQGARLDPATFAYLDGSDR
jgi:hypothetical protein